MLIAFGVPIYEFINTNRFTGIDADLQRHASDLRKAISAVRRQNRPPDEGPPPDLLPGYSVSGPRRLHIWPGRPPGLPQGPLHGPEHLPDLTIPAATAALAESHEGYYVIVWSRNSTIAWQSANAPKGSPPPASAERDLFAHFRTWAVYREIIHCTGVGDCVVVGRSVADELRNAKTIAWLVPTAGATVLTVGLLVSWWIIKRAVQPIRQIETTAEEIRRGKLSARVPVAKLDDELGQLSEALNATFARLESAFDRQKQFTSDAAHELRTPLAILISEAQSFLARPRNAVEYKEALENCLDTAQQMRKLTETLLDLARLDTNDAQDAGVEVDLAEVALQCIRQLRPMAALRSITLKEELSQARVPAGPDRMLVLLNNLVANAIVYSHAGGEVLVRTYQSGAHSILTVEDTGIGIKPEDLPHIFDRFFRADKVRSRDGGHAGLGLSICKSILDRVNGQIEVTSAIGSGTKFTVRFALARTSVSGFD